MTKTASKKRPIRAIYMVCRKMMDPETGELVGVLVPSSAIDSRLLRQKRIRIGQEVRVDLKNPRNSKFHRLIHVLGMLVADHLEDFQHLRSHDAIKRLQREAGICCEEQEVEIPGVGKLVIKVAQSIAFDEMDESEFRFLFEGICRYTAATYWPGLTEEQIEKQAALMPRYESAAA